MDESISLGFGRSKERSKDEPLWPEREPLSELARMRIEMGAYVFSAQYQQDPTPPLGGNRIRWEWFGSHAQELKREEFQWVVQSWDTALTEEPTSDFSVGMTWGFHDKQWYLLDLIRERLDFPDLKRRVRGAAEHWRADLVLIEYAGSGIPLVQQLRRDDPRGLRYGTYTPRQDKVTRLEAQTARLETGRYHLLPTRHGWVSSGASCWRFRWASTMTRSTVWCSS